MVEGRVWDGMITKQMNEQRGKEISQREEKGRQDLKSTINTQKGNKTC
jgi:hypothetical protein